jgi:uncharacterized protein YndB with AHSA1/START domain
MQTFEEKNSQPVVHKSSTPHSHLLEMERTFDVSVGKLFEAFKTSEALKVWWWPKGLHSDRIDLDFRVAGKYFINMKGFEQGGGGMTGEFEEITENKRIVMMDQFADENGRVISAKEAKMPGVWPERVYITFDFESVDESKSRVKLSQEGIPNESQKDCIQGWSEMFDKLENYLGRRAH